VGNIYADQRAAARAGASEGLLGPRRRACRALPCRSDLLAALAPHELEEVADRAAGCRRTSWPAPADKKEERFNGMLLVHTNSGTGAARLEELLRIQARRWLVGRNRARRAGSIVAVIPDAGADEFLPRPCSTP